MRSAAAKKVGKCRCQNSNHADLQKLTGAEAFHQGLWGGGECRHAAVSGPPEEPATRRGSAFARTNGAARQLRASNALGTEAEGRTSLTRTERAQERFARKNEAAELRRAFDTLDTKADGRLDAEELGRLLAKLSHRARKARLQHCLKHSSGHKLSTAAAQRLDIPERLDISSAWRTSPSLMRKLWVKVAWRSGTKSDGTLISC